MKKVKVQDAIGMALCHDISKIVPGEFKGVRFPRGHVIRPEDVPELLSLGKEHVYVMEEGAVEIHEDEAAVRIAQAVMGDNLTYEGPREGKTTIKATVKGLFQVNSSLLHQINAIEEVTVPCLPNYFPVEPGERVASGRVIPLMIKEEKIQRVEELCRTNGPAFHVKPFRKLRVGIIITGNEVYKGRIQDKFWPVLQEKLAGYETELLGRTYCPDDIDMLDQAVASYLNQEADLIIMTGGMSVDPDDLTPGAIKRSGAEVVSYGMPAQPGNMFMLAYKGKTAFMGVPGSAIFHKTTVLDIFLPRVFAGIPVTREDVIKLGEGGLCRNCEVCHYPICYFGR